MCEKTRLEQQTWLEWDNKNNSALCDSMWRNRAWTRKKKLYRSIFVRNDPFCSKNLINISVKASLIQKGFGFGPSCEIYRKMTSGPPDSQWYQHSNKSRIDKRVVSLNSTSIMSSPTAALAASTSSWWTLLVTAASCSWLTFLVAAASSSWWTLYVTAASSSWWTLLVAAEIDTQALRSFFFSKFKKSSPWYETKLCWIQLEKERHGLFRTGRPILSHMWRPSDGVREVVGFRDAPASDRIKFYTHAYKIIFELLTSENTYLVRE